MKLTTDGARRNQEARTMTMKLPKKTTLGDLIAAVTEEVSRVTRGSANTNVLVSYIVKDLIARRQVQLKNRNVLIMAYQRQAIAKGMSVEDARRAADEYSAESKKKILTDWAPQIPLGGFPDTGPSPPITTTGSRILTTTTTGQRSTSSANSAPSRSRRSLPAVGPTCSPSARCAASRGCESRVAAVWRAMAPC